MNDRRPAYEKRGDASDELEFHLEMMEQRLREQGLTAEQAEAEARKRFGDTRDVLSECRRLDRRLERKERRSDVLSDLVGDLRLAARNLWRTPTFSFSAVLTLALAIGATTALYSIVSAILLQPLPYESPQQLAVLTSVNDGRDWDDMPLPPGVFEELAPGTTENFDLAVYRPQRVTMLSTSEPRRVRSAAISINLLPLMGETPLQGRGFLESDEPNVAGAPCLIGQKLWQSELAGDSSSIGTVIRLEGDVPDCTLVGVIRNGFDFPEPETELWTLYRHDPATELWSNWFLRGVVRVRGDGDLSKAQNELDYFAQLHDQDLPFGGGWRFELAELRDTVVGDVSTALWLLFGAVLMVLLIASANLGGLLVARTSERRSEFALRSALGASRGRLARQLLAENLVLCTVGGLLGVAIATFSIELFRARPPVSLPRIDEIHIDGTVLLFAFVVTLLSALASWLPPLWQSSRRSSALGTRSRLATAGPQSSRLRSALVVAETTLAMTLLIGALLLIKSFATLASVPPGFETINTATAQIELPPSRYDRQAGGAFLAEVHGRIAALPGIESAGYTTGLPLNGVSMIDSLNVEGSVMDDDARPEVAIDSVSPGYFETIGVNLLAGRYFDDRDHGEAPPVAIINEELARRHFGNQPIGRRLIIDEDKPALTVVGVVGSIKQYGLAKDTPLQFFLPFAQAPRARAHFVVRSRVDVDSASTDLRNILRQLDPNLPVPALTPLEEELNDSVGRERFYAFAMGGFALLACLLASLGLYGVIAFLVERKRREMGLRLALGANRADVFRSVVQKGMLLGLVGVLFGTLSSIALARSMTSLLFGVEALDPLAFGLSAVLVLVIAAFASSLPARRAASLDPATTLRND